MVVLTKKGLQLRPCSSSQTKHVIIYYPRPDMEFNLRGFFVCVPVDRLISRETPSSKVDRKNFELLELPLPGGEYFEYSMSTICTPATRVGGGERTSPGLYFLGGLQPPENSPYELRMEYVLKQVYKYDLHKLPKMGSAIPCKDMTHGMSSPLVVQVGDDFIFVLGRGKAELNDTCKPVFQKYNFKKDVWFPLGSDQFSDMINNWHCDEQELYRLNTVPHVVIGRYIHVSIRNSSFTYDTAKNVWEDCKLFETFWSDRAEKSGFSPTNFYGRSVWERAIDVVGKKSKKAKYGGGGPPFGFRGRGILWNGNIILGIHHAPNCAVVAFLFDDETGKIVGSQRLSMDNLGLDGLSLYHGARLLDLGGDGYFCLVHFLSDYNIDSDYSFQIELVTFQVSRISKQTAAAPDGHGDYDDDHFLDCKFVSKEFVAEKCPDNIGHFYGAFCV